jgi:MFS family permease
VAVKELPAYHDESQQPFSIGSATLRRAGSTLWVIAIASLCHWRFSQAFLVLQPYEIGVDAAFVPMVLVVMHLVFSLAAYPSGVLADHIDRRLQLGIGTIILVGANVVLANASTVWLTALGAALWGLQLGVTQGLLGATIADGAPDRLRGTAFGIYDVAVGVGTFVASAGAGALWMTGGPSIAFSFSACVATAAALMLVLRPLPRLAHKA